jgi:signal transduction histidine kinase
MISGDSVQLQQVLMNLMINGIEAMKDTGGELTVTSKSTEDSHVLITVSDLGVGLPAIGAEHIFEAFFTTKPEGTGLGLAISQTIIESLGGRLWVTANAERGTTFQLTLPADAFTAGRMPSSVMDFTDPIIRPAFFFGTRGPEEIDRTSLSDELIGSSTPPVG